MTVEVRPLGVLCNIQCQYCYQNPQRDAGNLAHNYDLDKMKTAIRGEGRPFSLFGGEPLLIPEPDLEELFSWGFNEFGQNAIQTNGTLINDEHIRMFKRYHVSVGLSIDGPGMLNDIRWHGTLERTRQATSKTEASIAKLCHEGLTPSIIVTLHRNNATEDKLAILIDWVRYLDSIGIRWMRLHLLEIENPAVRAKYALSELQNIAALRAFRALQPSLHSLRIDLFDDMRRLLVGRDDGTTCVWNNCDPYTTRAVQGIEGHGEKSNCGRTNKDGIDFVKANTQGFERYLALYATPQEHGGCKGCRFFLMCKGQCPGTAIDGDWRNRTEHCEVWKSIFADIERDLIVQGFTPVSVSSIRGSVEHAMVQAWGDGIQKTMSDLIYGTTTSPQSDLNTPGWRSALHKLRRLG